MPSMCATELGPDRPRLGLAQRACATPSAPLATPRPASATARPTRTGAMARSVRVLPRFIGSVYGRTLSVTGCFAAYCLEQTHRKFTGFMQHVSK